MNHGAEVISPYLILLLTYFKVCDVDFENYKPRDEMKTVRIYKMLFDHGAALLLLIMC